MAGERYRARVGMMFGDKRVRRWRVKGLRNDNRHRNKQEERRETIGKTRAERHQAPEDRGPTDKPAPVKTVADKTRERNDERIRPEDP